MLIPAAITLLYRPLLPFLPNVEPRCSNRKQPRRISLKFARRARVECIRILLVTCSITVATLLFQRNYGNVKEERRDKRNCFQGNALTGILSLAICMSSSFILNNLFSYRSPACSLAKNVIHHVQSPRKLRLLKLLDIYCYVSIEIFEIGSINKGGGIGSPTGNENRSSPRDTV